MKKNMGRGFGRTEFDTIIVDDYGEPHRYEIVQHNAMEGFSLLPRVTRVFLDPLARAFKALDWKTLMAALQDSAKEVAEEAVAGAKGATAEARAKNALQMADAALGGKGGAAALQKLLDTDIQIDVPEIGAALGDMASGFEREGGAELLQELLKHCVRCEGSTNSGPKSQVAKEFGVIYQGNYGEALRAAWWAIQVNFGPALSRLPFAQGGRTR